MSENNNMIYCINLLIFVENNEPSIKYCHLIQFLSLYTFQLFGLKHLK